MINLTEAESKTYQSYIKTNSIAKTAQHTGKSTASVLRDLRHLVAIGLMTGPTKLFDTYKPTGETYQVGTLKEKYAAKKKHVIPIEMTDYEREWMLKNYKRYQKQRDIPAQALNRTRYDICMMAIALNLDMKENGGGGKSA